MNDARFFRRLFVLVAAGVLAAVVAVAWSTRRVWERRHANAANEEAEVAETEGDVPGEGERPRLDPIRPASSGGSAASAPAARPLAPPRPLSPETKFNQMVASLEALDDGLQALTPPAACRSAHRFIRGLVGEILEILEAFREAVVRHSAAAGWDAKARVAETVRRIGAAEQMIRDADRACMPPLPFAE